jgi:hypothetical protein
MKHGRERKRERESEVHAGFLVVELVKTRGHYECLDVDERTRLKCLLQKYDNCVDYILLAQSRDQLWSLVKAVMNLQV